MTSPAPAAHPAPAHERGHRAGGLRGSGERRGGRSEEGGVGREWGGRGEEWGGRGEGGEREWGGRREGGGVRKALLSMSPSGPLLCAVSTMLCFSFWLQSA